jgi:hypothetical protein
MDNSPEEDGGRVSNSSYVSNCCIVPRLRYLSSKSRLLRSTLTVWRHIYFLLAGAKLHPLTGIFGRALREALAQFCKKPFDRKAFNGAPPSYRHLFLPF